MDSVAETSLERQTAGIRREVRREWKITEMPLVNAHSLELDQIELFENEHGRTKPIPV